MEFVKYLLSLLNNQSSFNNISPILDNLSPIINLLKENSFDIQKTLKNIKIENIAPIVQSLLQNKKSSPNMENDFQSFGLTPISNIADKNIIYSLNKYLASDN